jgi:hypothetical protein
MGARATYGLTARPKSLSINICMYKENVLSVQRNVELCTSSESRTDPGTRGSKDKHAYKYAVQYNVQYNIDHEINNDQNRSKCHRVISGYFFSFFQTNYLPF